MSSNKEIIACNWPCTWKKRIEKENNHFVYFNKYLLKLYYVCGLYVMLTRGDLILFSYDSSWR